MKTNTTRIVALLFSVAAALCAQDATKLLPDDGAAFDEFGSAVALDGELALIGAPRKGNAIGAAYVFARTQGAWAQAAILRAGDGIPFDEFGRSVAISGDYAIIGAPKRENAQGAAYIFVRQGAIWNQQARLNTGEPISADGFGTSVGINGMLAVVGVPLENQSRGAVYVFTRSGSSWVLASKLVGEDSQPGDRFGQSVAIYGTSVIAGAPRQANAQGAAYVFAQSGTTWLQQAKLIADQPASFDNFGWSVSISDNYAVAGAPARNGANGSACVFVRNGALWNHDARLTVAQDPSVDQLGTSVANSDHHVLVGTSTADPARSLAHLFVRNGAAWELQSTFKASDGLQNDRFGEAIAMSKEFAIVGARGHDQLADDAGAAYAIQLPPSIAVSQDSFDLGAYTLAETFLIENLTTGDLTWNIISDQPWLTTSPSSGSTMSTPVEVQVNVNREELPEGSFTGKLTVDSNGGTRTITVDIQVIEIALQPQTIEFGSSRTTQELTILSSRTQDVPWTATADVSWITLTPNSGVIVLSHDSLIIEVNRAPLSPGRHSGNVTISTARGIETALVNLSVASPAVQPDSLHFEPTDMALPITLSNLGVDTLSWRLTASSEWLVFAPTTGFIIDQSLEIFAAVDRRQLKRGTVRDTLRMTTNGGDLDIPVSAIIDGFESITSPFEFKAGTTQDAYQIVSVPARLDDPTPGIVLGSLGRYGKQRWRLYDSRDGQNINLELPDTRDFEPGVGLFLIVSEPGKRIETSGGSYVTPFTDPQFRIPLVAGWNLIGNPYDCDIPLENLSWQSNDSLIVWRFDGGWLPDTTALRPWTGYAVAVSAPDTLRVMSCAANSSELSLKSTTLQTSTTNWNIRITARCQGGRDDYNFAGVHHEALAGKDRYDLFEPPLFGEFVRVTFPHQDWGTVLPEFTSDIRSPSAAGQIWDFAVSTSYAGERVVLEFDLNQVPADEVWLADPQYGVTRDLRTDPFYHFTASSGAKHLQLIVGPPDFAAQHRDAHGFVPAQFELLQNFPNPFNAGTTIRFGLPQEERVTLSVFNIIGEEVATPYREQLFRPGYHAVQWNRQSTRGTVVTSGIYLLQLRAGSFRQSIKMVVVE